jgi:hypothetical protein
MQTIVLAMLIGSATALLIFVLIQDRRPARPADAAPVLTYVGLAFTVLTVALSFVMPALCIAQARKRIAQGTWQPATRSGQAISVPPTDAGKLLAIYGTALIIGAALLEGPTFFLAIAYYLEGQLASLVAAGVLIGALAARMPTQARVGAWLERQLSLIEQERQGSPQRE